MVESFVKNDHLGFTILYNHKGVIRKFYPDFMLRLVNGDYMVLETKGVDSQQNQTKREYLNEWINAGSSGSSPTTLRSFANTDGGSLAENGVPK